MKPLTAKIVRPISIGWGKGHPVQFYRDHVLVAYGYYVNGRVYHSFHKHNEWGTTNQEWAAKQALEDKP